MVAIIPAAGKGTRMQAVTQGRPKELLTLGRSTVLGRVIDEALAADVDEVVVVSTTEKREIEEYIRERHSGRVKLNYQTEPRGLADALLAAEVEGDALVMLGDVVFRGGSPAERLSTLVSRGGDGCIAVEQVSDKDMERYGICEIDEGTGQILRVLEKPQPQDTDSRWAVAARYAFSAALMSHIAEQALTAIDPPDLTHLLNGSIQRGFDIKAVALQPWQERVDCGSPEGYNTARWLDWE